LVALDVPAGVLVGLPGHRRRDLAGRHGVHRDAVRGELDRGGPGEQAQSTLGGAVGPRADPWLVLVDAGDVDDATAATVRHHVPRRALQADEGAIQVGGHRPSPVREVEVDQEGARARAGALHQHVDAAQSADQRLEVVPCFGQPGEVHVRHLGTHAGCPDLGRGLLGAVRVLVPADPDVAAGGGQGDGHGPADARVGAGDDRSSWLAQRRDLCVGLCGIGHGVRLPRSPRGETVTPHHQPRA